MSDVLCVTAKLDCQCPLWVKSIHRGTSNQCPLYPQKRTYRALYETHMTLPHAPGPVLKTQKETSTVSAIFFASGLFRAALTLIQRRPNVRFVPLPESCSAAKNSCVGLLPARDGASIPFAGGNNGCRVALADAEYAAPAIGLLNES